MKGKEGYQIVGVEFSPEEFKGLCDYAANNGRLPRSSVIRIAVSQLIANSARGAV